MRDRSARAASTAVRAIVAVVALLGTVAVAVIGAVVTVTPAAAEGEVRIEVSANGEPADSAPGPLVESGATVNLRYVITVGSSEPLYDFVVANLTGDIKPNCDTDGDGQPNGADGHPGPLAGGESFSCVATVVAGDPGVTFASVGRVTAYDFDITQTFVHEDAAHYTTVRPTTTQVPTTQTPTTAAPTTSSTTSTTPASSTSSASTASTSTTTTTTTTTSSRPSPSTTADPTTTATSTDEDAGAPDELAATDEPDGFPVWWVVLAFSVGGGTAIGVSSLLSGKNAAVPDH